MVRARLCIRVLTAVLPLAGGLAVPIASNAAAPARQTPSVKTVHYRGLSLRVPRTWPVFDLSRDRETCVRFNRHAVYLGVPGRNERCPAHAAGRTDAILLMPAASGGSASISSLVKGHATSFLIRSASVEVIATWSRSPELIASALGSRSLPGSRRGSFPAPALNSSISRAGPTGGAATAAAGKPTATVYTGLGFDTCTAPSRSQMSAWSSSPYRAVGVYIGGVNSACAQPNLTGRWVSNEISAGWHVVPIYVGLQAPANSCGCSPISTNTTQAKAQGQAAATDAVSHAKALGIPAGNPIYFDMEGYATGGSNTASVLAFLSGWTLGLHSDGYLSGTYSSAGSGITDLVAKYGTSYPEPDDIWIADWNGQKTTSDAYLPTRDWADHQRLHQYFGDEYETYGGVTMDIDGDYLDGLTAYARKSFFAGYSILTSDGGVHTFGAASTYGSDVGKLPMGVHAVSLAVDRATGGYWILKSDGGVNHFNAPWDGSLRGKLSGLRPTAIAPAPGGYLILTSDGGVHPFGAKAYGSDAGKLAPEVRPVSLAVDAATGGYWILKSDGGVNHFNAPWDGSLRGKLSGLRPTAIAPAPGGYLILTSDGGVHPFGAKAYGSDAGTLPTGISAVSLGTSPSRAGYRILRSDGGVDGFGAKTYGSLRGKLQAGQLPRTIADGG